MPTKRFSLRDLLTVTTGRLLTKRRGPRDNGIGALYALLGWMTGDQPHTHQLGRFADMGPVVDAACNEIRGDSSSVETAICQLVFALGERYGKHEYDVPQIPRDDHERKGPYDELVAERGSDEGIIVF